MSLSIDSTMATTSIMSQLKNMQSQLNTMAQAAMPTNGNIQNAENTDNVPKVVATGDVQAPKASDSVGQFQAMLQSAFEDMNNLQNTSSSMQSRFDVGDRSVTLADVMIASQKASLSFEATLQIRNKMVEAYKSVMQMSI